MTPELEALGRQAVACKGWRWMPGMHATVPKNLPMAWGTTRACRIPHSVHPTMVPDLSDPATLGCLLALVRDAWGDPLAHVAPVAGGWRVWLEVDLEVFFDGATEAEALVAALEAAP